MKRLLSSALYILLSIMGLNFLVIALFLLAQYMAGRVDGRQFANVARVLAGRAMPIEDPETYKRFLAVEADEAKYREELVRQYGSVAEGEEAARAARQVQADLQDKLAIAVAQLNDAANETLGVRRQVEELKTAIERQQRMFRDEVARRAAVEMDAQTRRFRAIMANTDAANTARLLEGLSPDEAARMMREHFPPDYSAEVSDEMRPEAWQAIFPKIENPYAGVTPEQIVRMWTDRQYGAAEMAVHLRNMNAVQALSVFLALPPALRDDLGPLLVNPQAAR